MHLCRAAILGSVRRCRRSSPLSVFALVVLTALGGCGPAGRAMATRPNVPRSALVPTDAPGATTTPSPAATLAGCGAPRPLSALTRSHRFSVSPDDITMDASGRLWVTARSANLLVGLSSTGTAVTVQNVSGGPEGIAADGSTLYVAQQDRNAIVAVASTTRALATFPNRAADAGSMASPSTPSTTGCSSPTVQPASCSR